jgi:HEAT repeat protein
MWLIALFAANLSAEGIARVPSNQSAALAAASAPFDVDRAKSLLDRSLRHGNPDRRMRAVQALGQLHSQEPFVWRLESMLNDKDVQVRLATIKSLADMKSPRTVPALKKALGDRVPEVRFAAAKALFALNDPAGREALVSVLNNQTKTSSGFIAQQVRDGLRLMHTPKPLFVMAMQQGIGFAPVPGLDATVMAVTGILTDNGVSARAATALLLSADADPLVLAALRRALADRDWSVRAAAVHAIALRNDPAFEADLIPLLRDKKEAVRLIATTACLRLEWIKSNPE